MKKFMTIWIGELISSIGTGEGRGIGLMLIITGIVMFVFAFIFGFRKSIKDLERSTNEQLVIN